jgi:hypothetical protein
MSNEFTIGTHKIIFNKQVMNRYKCNNCKIFMNHHHKYFGNLMTQVKIHKVKCMMCLKSGCTNCFYHMILNKGKIVNLDYLNSQICEECKENLKNINHDFLINIIIYNSNLHDDNKHVMIQNINNKHDIKCKCSVSCYLFNCTKILKNLLLISKRPNKYIPKFLFKKHIIPCVMDLMNIEICVV